MFIFQNTESVCTAESFVFTMLNHNTKLENNQFRVTGFSKLWENSPSAQWRAEDSRCSYSNPTRVLQSPGLLFGLVQTDLGFHAQSLAYRAGTSTAALPVRCAHRPD